MNNETEIFQKTEEDGTNKKKQKKKHETRRIRMRQTQFRTMIPI